MKINRHILDNGLRLVHSQDESTQMVALNVLYNVGARDEHPEHTGFAHLFEHLMFGGSVNIPDYDMPLQLAGGENNAWTNNDITNYYLTVPRQNVETGFWLESDRMLSLDFSERSLEVQRGVVMEAALPEPALRRRRSSFASSGISGAYLSVAYHRKRFVAHSQCDAGRGESILLPFLCAEQCSAGRNGKYLF